ncbi:DUF192 domain-containing protein [Lacticigenium naphthae]|uniref:DUF192 domain-containing protein n=1 Tax=Lacticigenium naphthae TaxID=515351 RepID=UPI000418789C|nr:DUF192 domain-containing protein [Lacticigenium naphthae]
MSADYGTTKLINQTTETVLIEQLLVAQTFFGRLKGLLGKKTLSKKTGLKIVPSTSVHTFFMHFPIDIVFFNGADEVLAVMENVRPRRISKIYREAAYVIEANAFELAPFVEIGDKVVEK